VAVWYRTFTAAKGAGLQPDTDRLGHIAVQERDSGGGLRVFGMVSKDEQRTVPLTAVDRAGVGNDIPSVPTPSTAPVVATYSSIRPGRDVNPVIQSISWFAPQ
jgi:hypothetical protein